jgi:hypothetical protein
MIEGAPLDYLFVFVPMDVGLNSANMLLNPRRLPHGVL